MRKVSFHSNSIEIYKPFLRRVGRPRKNWLIETFRLAWNSIRDVIDKYDEEYNTESIEQREILKAAAEIRIF